MTLIAAVDLGGTSIKGALADETGTILVEQTIPTESHAGPRVVLERTATLIHQLVARLQLPSQRLLRLGVGLPGLVDLAAGTTKFLPNLPGHWRDVPVAKFLEAQVDCPVRLLNDARAATLGELRFGHGRDEPQLTLAFFTLGTGVGGGLAIDGRLRLGPFGAAGELGHQTIVPDGPHCGCGNRGCLESLASGPAISAEGIRLLRAGQAPKLFELVEGHGDRVTPREMLAAAHAGDVHVAQAIRRAATFVGIAAANVVTMLHPDLIVLGGGVAELGELLLDVVRDTISQRVGMFPADDIRVEKSQLGERAGLLGAVALALDAEFPESSGRVA